MKDRETISVCVIGEISVIDAPSLDERELRYVALKPGGCRLSQIPNPFETKYGASPWWVVEGTQHGMGIPGWTNEPDVVIIPEE